MQDMLACYMNMRCGGTRQHYEQGHRINCGFWFHLILLSSSYIVHVAAGGQAKRCNIGIALMADPRFLFLDEPTSGLDSYTSQEACMTPELHALIVLWLTCKRIAICVQVWI